jgi:hypothetical protein
MNRPPSLSRTVPSADRQIAITYLTPERFEAKPQVGIRIIQEWHAILRWLTWPTVAAAKPDCGAWCPTQLDGGIVKAGSGPVSLLVADVDECEAGAMDETALPLSKYAGAVVPTFNATLEKPKHRITLLPSRDMTPEEFPLCWTKMASTLEDAGIVVDRGCKNINRLYFGCVTKSLESWLGARLLPGEPVDIDWMLYAMPKS